MGVSQLVNAGGYQLSLWEEEDQRKAVLERVMDELQGRFGGSALTHADTLLARSRKQNKK
ncbi:MAG: hypothetical protein D6681_12275 [Calditrichaeota bacterium]|nr:MAG: hypothetical protein D6681_12275 [Calditrichota bacterium]